MSDDSTEELMHLLKDPLRLIVNLTTSSPGYAALFLGVLLIVLPIAREFHWATAWLGSTSLPSSDFAAALLVGALLIAASGCLQLYAAHMKARAAEQLLNARSAAALEKV